MRIHPETIHEMFEGDFVTIEHFRKIRRVRWLLDFSIGLEGLMSNEKIPYDVRRLLLFRIFRDVMNRHDKKTFIEYVILHICPLQYKNAMYDIYNNCFFGKQQFDRSAINEVIGVLYRITDPDRLDGHDNLIGLGMFESLYTDSY